MTSDTGDQAHKYLNAFRSELESNPKLQEDYPGLARPGPIWREDRIRLNNGVMIEAVGTGTKLRGRKNRQHQPSLIIVADPQNIVHIISPLQRKRSWEWLTKDVCNARGLDTNIVTLGTALHRECLVCRLQTTPGWVSQLFCSIIAWPTRMDQWAQWELLLHNHEDKDREARALAFYEKNKATMDAGAVVLWPAREPLYKLMQLRAAIGSAAFISENQNDPINPELCEWPESYFGPDIWFDEWPGNLELRSIGLDPSKGKDAKHGDFSAFVLVGRDKHGVLYKEPDLRKDRTAEAIIDEAIEHQRRFKADVFGVEVNMFQELLAGYMSKKAAAAGVMVPIVPIVNMIDKKARITRLGPYLAQK